MSVLLQLYWSFFQIGLFSIGGGYAAMPLIKQQIVDNHAWITMADFADIVAISQMTPGPVAINAATFVGQRIGGLPGAIIATLGCITPPFVISVALAKLYYKYRNLSLMQGVLGGLRPAVVAMIASAGLSIIILAVWNGGAPSLDIASFDFIAIGLFIVAFGILRKFKISPTLAMLGCGIVGMVIYYFTLQ